MASVVLNRPVNMLALPIGSTFSVTDVVDNSYFHIQLVQNFVNSIEAFGNFTGDSSDLTGVIRSMNLDVDDADANVDMAIGGLKYTMDSALYVMLGSGNMYDAAALLFVGNDTFTGSSGDDAIEAYGGNDKINGGGGVDLIYGMNGADLIKGGDGDDTLAGGDGADKIQGQSGGDSLWGNAGADLFVYRLISDSDPMAIVDVIEDFQRKAGDKIDLSGIDADANTLGNQQFTFIGQSDFSGTAGELHYFIRSDGVAFTCDVTGDGSEDFGVIVAGISNLKSTDFVL